MILPISQLGNPILRDIARRVVKISNPIIQSLIDDMIHTCQNVDSVGIAAPQVNRSLRLFIIASKPSPRYPHAPVMEPTAIINPVIVSASTEMEKDWEGCSSIPGIRGMVSRHRTVSVWFINRQGRQVKVTFNDFIARVFQHEYDHIDGIVFLDKTDSKDLVMESEYQKIIHKPSN